MAMKLNPKQRKFALEYLKDFNGKAAAIRAGYSPHTAKNIASRLLAKVNLADFVEKKVEKLEESQWLRVEDLERELHRLAFFDPSRLIGPDGKALPLEKLDEDTRRALSGVDIEELFEGRGDERELVGLLRKVRWHDKRAAIELAMKRRSLLVDRSEVELKNVAADISDDEMEALAALRHQVRGKGAR